MYQIGDVIMYRMEGACRVDAIGVPDSASSDNDRLYYTLSPNNRDGLIYIPVDTAVFMRPVITYEEVQYLIQQIPHITTNISNENRNLKMLSDHYEALLQTHDCADLLQLIKSVYAKRQIAAENGKKLGKIDEHFLQLAEELLYGEFAIVLGIPKDQVKSYIEARIKLD
ncbi:MAG: CarD family transcriptional regulator [Deltaproteobacteria bacterium]